MTDPKARLTIWLKRVLNAATLIESYLDGLEKEDFLEDRRTQDAVSMNLLVIGENATKLLASFSDELNFGYRDIEWKAMRGMRNRMAHGYEETDFEMVWMTVKTYIPDLITKLQAKGV